MGFPLHRNFIMVLSTNHPSIKLLIPIAQAPGQLLELCYLASSLPGTKPKFSLKVRKEQLLTCTP